MIGGYDLVFQYIHYVSNVPAPPWIWLIMAPFGALPYPIVWYAWMVLSIGIVAICMRVLGHSPWMVILSCSMVANLWYGQVEALVLLGVVVAWLTIRHKAPPALMGIAWLLMLIKPQVALIPCVLFAAWMFCDRGIKSILIALISAPSVVVLSLAIYPNYIADIQATMHAFVPVPSNASVLPWGLVALPVLLLPFTRMERLQVALAVNLLVAPYFQMYHTTTLLAVTGSPILAVLSWLPFAAGMMQLAWIVPAAFVAFKVAHLLWARIDLHGFVTEAEGWAL